MLKQHKDGVKDFCLPLLAVIEMTKTLSTRPWLWCDLTAVMNIKWWINSFERHTVTAE